MASRWPPYGLSMALISPIFALDRSQELLLILDEYWKAHPELHDVPIFYASKVRLLLMAPDGF